MKVKEKLNDPEININAGKDIGEINIMNIKLSDHFTYRKLLRFTLPSIIMMVITSIYGVVDGFFVSNFVGADAFAALNLIVPFVMIFSSVGFMLGTGGSALVAKTMGEGDHDKANQIFSMLVYVMLGIGMASTLFGLTFIRPIAIMLGAQGEILEMSITYGRILLMTLPFFILQISFESFLMVAEMPDLGLKVSIAAGLTNVFLDYFFIVVMDWGITGAALATASSQIVGAMLPFLYFATMKSSRLRMTKPYWNGAALLKASANGSSEMLTGLSLSLVNMLYNVQLMKIAGPNGVAAYGIIMYMSFLFMSVFIGYSIGSAPIISYHYGAKNHDELKNLFKKSMVLVGGAAIIMLMIAEGFATPLARIFVGYDLELLALSTRALRLYSISFLFSGINLFSSAFFTALNNGGISAFISFLRTLVLQVVMILFLPTIFGIDGVWLAVVVAEVLTFIVTVFLFIRNKDRYHYL